MNLSPRCPSKAEKTHHPHTANGEVRERAGKELPRSATLKASEVELPPSNSLPMVKRSPLLTRLPSCSAARLTPHGLTQGYHQRLLLYCRFAPHGVALSRPVERVPRSGAAGQFAARAAGPRTSPAQDFCLAPRAASANWSASRGAALGHASAGRRSAGQSEPFVRLQWQRTWVPCFVSHHDFAQELNAVSC